MTKDEYFTFDTIEDVVEDIKNGQMVIVLDSEERENEGDLVAAAESITTEQMAFMIRYTSGLICAPMAPHIASRLDLRQMVSKNTDANGTAFTVTVDSFDPSLSTGISAHDRALTCRQLASPKARAGDFRRPGHIAPLRERDGGLTERRGHTEATVALCRLAGRTEVGVIGEMIEEGLQIEGEPKISGPNGMLRRDGCLQFGRRWGIKVCTTEDLVSYLKKKDPSKLLSTR
ncbi:3,4-dihydroxy-2-butanone-4-phosphate synthase [Aspergillus lucknowensis]|uniref:3,4-dihydroxy-2-butanone 4-phosphate synthase n=1 Tax=Aspergillus lucknowensis TaxID=176173 RepID=A0ABR4LRW3_9EURO